MNLQALLDSYSKSFGEALIPRDGDPKQWAARLDAAPFVLVAHGNETDPILNYGNRKALELWEMSWEEFIRTPSRLTAEVPNQAERARLLAEVSERGCIHHYFGIRISKGGRRFRIENARLWNLRDSSGRYLGQAATFAQWVFLASPI